MAWSINSYGDPLCQICVHFVSKGLHVCHNLSLGLATKAKVCKGAGQEGSPGVTSRVLESVKECEKMVAHTPKGTSLWELES